MAEPIFKRIFGTIIPTGFKLQSASPLDVRTVVDSKEDMVLLIEENGAYEGMMVYVKEDKNTYVLKDLNSKSWEKQGGMEWEDF